jgi:hypothetical protein
LVLNFDSSSQVLGSCLALLTARYTGIGRFTASYTAILADLDNRSIIGTATASGTPPTGPALPTTSTSAGWNLR